MSSKIVINPITKNLEIELSDDFLLKYFDTLGFHLTPQKTVHIGKAKTTTTNKTKRKFIRKPRAPKGAIQQAILDVIKNEKDGVSIKDIVEATELNDTQIYSVVYKLKKDGIISSPENGLYVYIKPNVE